MAAATATKAKPPLDLNEESTGAPLGKDPKNPGRDSKVSRMGTASIPRLITEFAIPAILGMVVNGAYNVVDSIFLGPVSYTHLEAGDLPITTYPRRTEAHRMGAVRPAR